MTTLHIAQTIVMIMAFGIGIAMLCLTVKIMLDDHRFKKQDFGARTTEVHSKTEGKALNSEDRDV